MQVEQLTVPLDKVKEEYRAFKELVQSRKNDYLKELHKIYGHMRHGKKVIDIVSAIKKGSVNEHGEPRLAICKAHSSQVVFEKDTKGAGAFFHTFKQNPFGYGEEIVTAQNPIVKLPEATFPFWVDHEGKVATYSGAIKDRRLCAPVPIIPASILAPLKGKLSSFCILWEVERWKPMPPRDPILLKKITNQFYVVLATWDLTELERAVIRGRIE